MRNQLSFEHVVGLVAAAVIAALLLILTPISAPATAGDDQFDGWTENDWSKYLQEELGVDSYQREFVLADDSRVDLFGQGWAIEIDWVAKYQEGVTQAQRYGQMSGERPGLILLCEDRRKEKTDIVRATMAARNASTPVWFFDISDRRFYRGDDPGRLKPAD